MGGAAVAAGAVAAAAAKAAVAEYAMPSPVQERMGRPTAAAAAAAAAMLRVEAAAGMVAEGVTGGKPRWKYFGTGYAYPCIANGCAQG
jgi:hypothetical protein